MKIESNDRNIQQLFTMGYLKIPRFQRAYSWEKAEVEDFWADTVVGTQGDYFIGSIVVFKYGSDFFGVVDGQQRLTTITMLLCAVRNRLKIEGFTDLASGLHRLIEREDINDKLQFVLQTETSYPFLQERIQTFDQPDQTIDTGEEEQRLQSGFKLLTEYVQQAVEAIASDSTLNDQQKKKKTEKKLCEIRDAVLHLKVILVALENEDDAYTIFETLNTRGRDLTVSDLIRTHLTRLLPQTNKNVDRAKDRFQAILADFEASEAEIGINQFLHHLWLSQYEYTTEKNLYKAIKKRIKTKDDAKVFLNELEYDAELYRQIHEPESRTWRIEEHEIRDSLHSLNLFRVRQQLPFVLAILHAYKKKELNVKNTRKALCAIENFHFIFTAITSQRSSGGISFMYALHARELRNATSLPGRVRVIDDLIAKLKSKLPDYQEFEANFRELLCSEKFTKRKPIVQYTLNRLSQCFLATRLDSKAMTIEHLANQSGSGFKDEEVAAVGNLVWVSEQMNNKLANKSFVEKMRLLSKNTVWLDDYLKKPHAQWTPNEIHQRTNFLAKIAYSKVWKS